MNKQKPGILTLVVPAIIAAAYAALTVVLAPISYGPIQFRVSEALTILPFLMPGAVWGIFIGCVLANLFTGSVLDIVFGSLATLLAGLLTAWFGKKGNTVKYRLLGCLMPVLFNAVIVGAVLTWGYQFQEFPNDPLVSYGFNALTVGLGEAGVLFVLGFPLMRWLPRQRFFVKALENLRKGS